MGTIVEKLEYLDGTREKILTETNRLGVGLTEQDKFRDYAKGLHNGYVDILNNGIDILYDNMEKVSGSGSDITLENTEEAPMRSELKGNLYQETTTGKNLFGTTLQQGCYTFTNGNYVSSSNIYVCSTDFISVESGKTYTLSFKGNSNNYNGMGFIFYNNGTYVNYSQLGNNVVTIPSGINQIKFDIYNPNRITPSNIYEVQLEKGSTATEWEEYTGGQPSPNPDYSQEVQVVSGRQEVSVVGKNLFDYRDLTTKTNAGLTVINTNGELSISGTSTSTSFLNIIVDTLNLKAGTYTMSAFNPIVSSDSGMDLRITKTGGSDMVASVYLNVANNKKTFTLSEDLVNGRLIIRTSNGQTLTNFKLSPMIEKGNQATTYEVYTGQSYEINLGKQLLDLKNGTYTATNGITATVENGEITLNGTSTEVGFVQIDLNTRYNLEKNTPYTVSANNLEANEDVRIRLDNNGNLDTTLSSINASRTITYNNETLLYTKVAIRVASGITLTNYKFRPMLEKGSQATSYAPYKTPIKLCEINDYEDMIFRGKGVNLLDTQYYENGSIDGSTGQNVSAPYNARGNNYIPVKPNTTYTFFANTSCSNLRLSEYKQDKEHIQRDITANRASITITTTANTYFVRWSMNYNNSTELTEQIIDSLDLMLCEGNSTIYEPYNSKGKWLLHKEIGKVVLNGSESWSKGSSRPFYTLLINDVLRLQSASNNATLFCNYLSPSTPATIWGNNINGITNLDDSNAIRIRIQDNPYTITTFKEWLNDVKPVVYYVLATPTTTEITDSELINQLEEWYNQKSNKDVTYISVTSEDLPAILNVIAIKKYE